MNTLGFEPLATAIEQAVTEFKSSYDANRLIDDARTALVDAIEKMIITVIQQVLYDPSFLAILKGLGQESALRFNGYRPTSIRLLSGQSLSIASPYFIKASKKSRRKTNKRKTKTGVHLGLAYLGFIGRCSGALTSAAVQAALLSPSFEIAQRTLISFGIALNIKTIKRLCSSLGDQAMENRCRMSLSDTDGVENRTLFVCIDGGRIRERTPKRGRRPKEQKRQGYHTDWREPIQIVIQWLDTEGNKCKQTVPLYDATMGDINAAFELLEGYLLQMNASKADMVIFCADGARSYWKRFSALARKLKLNGYLEIIDYTHAKQNLKLIADQLPKKLGAKKLAEIFKDWKNLLWHGELGEIHHQIRQLIKSNKKRKEAMNKFKNYFLKNFRRMQYCSFRHLDMPTGSGCVESAIRRVINLRLKAPGIFWKRETAEVMLYLRSTLLCGRWQIMLRNLFLLNRGQLEGCN